MSAATTNASAPQSEKDRLDTSPRLLLWLVRFTLPVFIIGTLMDPGGLQLIDRIALAICPLTWLLFERAARGQVLGRADTAPDA